MPPKIDIVYEVDALPLQVDRHPLPVSLAAQLQMGVKTRSGVSNAINAGSERPGHISAMIRSLDRLRYRPDLDVKPCTPVAPHM